jgi:hypothetical protein
MKIKKLKVTNNLKNKILLIGATLVLIPTLTGCSKASKHAKPELHSSSPYVSEHKSTITDEDIKDIPQDTQHISFTKCHYVTDLSSLPEQCPEVVELSLKNCPNITNLSFIYDMKNLKSLTLNDIPGITPELITYLEDNEISYKIEEEDIIAAEKARKIIDEIITDDMTDEEKTKAIVLYVSKNTTYKLFKAEKSNEDPLQLALNEKEGVCEGIAYTTNVLLRMANVESYLLENSLHAWNLVKIDGEYYYIDVTNLGGGLVLKRLAGFLIDKFNFGTGGYMIDPETTALTFMTDYDSEKIIIPEELIEDIKNNIDERSIFEKYKNTVPTRIIELAIIIFAIKKIKKIGENIEEEKSYKKK